MSFVLSACVVLAAFNNLHAAVLLTNHDLFRLDIVHYNDFHDRFVSNAFIISL